ncbi:hypothetical protein Tco_1493391 [Tanacetum coccineum]
MKELYDKVQASIEDSFNTFIPMDSEKEREMLKEREAKRLLRKRKATIAEEQPSKKPNSKLLIHLDGENLIIFTEKINTQAFDTYGRYCILR